MGVQRLIFAQHLKKNSDAWLHEECGNYPKGKMITMNNLKIKLVNKALSGTNIAYHSNPNRDTLIYYLWKYSYRDRSSHLKEFKSTNSSYDFKFNLIEDKFVKKQMKTKAILSYLGDLKFANLAKEISKMDLVISSDTSILHLSSSLGVKTYGLLSFVADWRWADNKKKTNWYDTLEIFRLKKNQSWEDLSEKIADMIKEIK